MIIEVYVAVKMRSGIMIRLMVELWKSQELVWEGKDVGGK